METIVHYFETIPSSHRSAILAGGIAFFWLIESLVPMFRFGYNKWKHASVNIFFTLTTVIINFILAFILLSASDWMVAHQAGLLNWLPTMPLWAYGLLGLLLLDLIGAYTAHWVEHKVRFLWLFHLVHHSDLQVDTTTANRHHPGESVIRFTFTLIAVVLAGAPIWLVMLYQSLSVVLSQFNHANIRLPDWLDRALSYVIVSPNMHKIHHHYRQPYTDTNYGNIFAFWDRMFGTYRDMDVSTIVYGIDTHMAEAENAQIGNLLQIPFQPYRQPGPPEA